MFSNKKLAVAVSGAVLLMAGQFALADSTTDIVDALVGKGVLTEEEGKLITKGHETKKKVTMDAKFKDGFVLESADGNNSIKIGGRLHADYRNFQGNSVPAGSTSTLSDKQSDTFDVRRARIELSGTYRKYYDFLLSADLAGASTGVSTCTTSCNILDQAYLNIKWIPEAQLRFGQFKQPMNLEKLTSSNNVDFQERSVVNQLAGNEDRGAMVWGEPRAGFTYAGGIFTGAGAKNRNDQYAKNDEPEYTGRLTANFAQFVDNKDAIVHLGASGSTTAFSAEGTGTDGWFSGSAALRTEARGHEFLKLPTLAAATSSAGRINRYRSGLEGIFAYNNFKVQAEYLDNTFKGNTGAGVASSATATGATANMAIDNSVNSYYIEALYLITGEKYADFYKGGAFGAIKPKNEYNFDNKSAGLGAWEIGYRHSEVDAKDFSSWIIMPTNNSMSLKATTDVVGLKWIPNNNTRILLNYVSTSFDTPVTLGTGTSSNSEKAITTRVQFMF
jgi:phosphate-selective porin OprO/OprP